MWIRRITNSHSRAFTWFDTNARHKNGRINSHHCERETWTYITSGQTATYRPTWLATCVDHSCCRHVHGHVQWRLQTERSCCVLLYLLTYPASSAASPRTSVPSTQTAERVCQCLERGQHRGAVPYSLC